MIQSQIHGYKQGHQLLSTSIQLADVDQDVVNRLSDLTGPLRPRESFLPYLTAYPLPSETYYVLARTFQDLRSSRSGCVRTKSVFVPMEQWERMESFHDVLPGLVCPEPNHIAVGREVALGERSVLETVEDGRMPQLLDAIFADRRPVVMFDCAESEAVAIRLMLALWPAVRRRFCVCTFALGPRSLGNRFFDLVFAPLSARSRFVGSGHRHLGGSDRLRSSPGDPDSSWADSVAFRVFRSDDPSLMGLDPIGFFQLEEGRDRTTLRVVSLWNELASRTKTTPTAVLGMLDIVRTRKGMRDNILWSDLEETVLKAIKRARLELPVEAAWEFMFALAAKLEGDWASRIVRERIEEGACRLALRDAGQAVLALTVDTSRRSGSKQVVKGLADGLSQSLVFSNLAQELAALPRFALAHLMTLSVRFGTEVVKAANGGCSPWGDILLGAFEAADEVESRVIRLQTLTDGEGFVLEHAVPRMLAGMNGAELGELVVDALRSRRSSTVVLNRLFWKAASERGNGAVVRDAVMEKSEGAEADGFILETLALSRSDVKWLASRKDDEHRANRLLRALLTKADDEDVRSMSQEMARRVVGLLRTDVDASKREIVRVLTTDVIRDQEALDVGFQTLLVLSREDARIELGQWILGVAMSVAHPDDERVSVVLADFGAGFEGADLVRMATSNLDSGGRVGANLAALDAGPCGLRKQVVREVEGLSRTLVERQQENLGGRGYGAWASLIRDWKKETHSDGQTRVASLVFRFALELEKEAVSALIIETFPIAYKSLPRTGKYRRRGGLSASSAPYGWRLGLGDWDDSRKRAINELVRAFMNSKWPPADLIIAALESGVERKVIRQVRERPRGRRYIDEIRSDAQRLRKGTRTRVLKCLAARP